MRRYFCFLGILCCLSCFAADDEFYRYFLTQADTNDLTPRLLRSPLLVDTNNTGVKLTNTKVKLDTLLSHGELGGIRLGMTMDEVVGRWGKPKGFYTRCGGGPRFMFTDADLVFRGNALWRVWPPGSLVFDKGLTAHSNLRDWTKALGKPTRRVAGTNSSFVLGFYESARCSLRLDIDPDREGRALLTIELPTTPVAPRK